MASPAWLTQRSLAIITFDEDAQDYQHPAQRVPTIVLGSDGVRAGYVSSVRYTHYSLLHTIEAALGLGTLTANDRYAQPLNDIFDPDTDSAAAPDQAKTATAQAKTATAQAVSLTSAKLPAGPQQQARQAQQATRTTPNQPTAWIANYGSATVTRVNLTTRKAGRAINVGADPDAVVVTPNGRTV